MEENTEKVRISLARRRVRGATCLNTSEGVAG